MAEEIESNEQKIIIEEGDWYDIDETFILNLANSFVKYADENKIPFDNFDFTDETNDREYYRTNFPKFSEDVIDILIDCSNMKIEDERKNILKKKHGEFIINFIDKDEDDSKNSLSKD